MPPATDKRVYLREASRESGLSYWALKRFVAKGLLKATRPAGGRGWLMVSLNDVMKLRERPA